MNELLKKLGVTSEGEGLVVVARFNDFLTTIMAMFGTKDFSDSLAVISAHADTVKAIEKLTGKEGAEALGTVTAWKAADERATAAEAKVAEIEAGIEAKDAEAKIDKVIADERLEPAKKDKAMALYSDHGMGALTAYCEALPAKGTAVNGGGTLSPTNDGSPRNGELTDDEKAVMKATGKTKAQMLKARRVKAIGDASGETRFEVEDSAA